MIRISARLILSFGLFICLSISALGQVGQTGIKGKITGQQGNILSGAIVYQLGKMTNNTTSDAMVSFA